MFLYKLMKYYPLTSKTSTDSLFLNYFYVQSRNICESL